MNCQLLFLMGLGALLLPATIADAEQAPPGRDPTDKARTRVETISAQRHTYTVKMGGLFDGEMTREPIGYGAWSQVFEPNRVVRMENVGDAPVKNPWIIVNGKRRWRSTQETVDSVLKPGMTDREKALALWWHEINSRFHATTGTSESNDPAKVHNVYGYTLCGNDAIDLSGLWSVAGLKVRACHIQGHCITEVFADGRWNLLDGDEQGLYLLRDNKTIASQVALTRDHDLIKRHHTYGILADESRSRDEFSASLFCYEDARGKYNPNLTHTMDMTLRPGEALEWRWGHEELKFHGKDHIKGWGPVAMAKVCNGKWLYELELTKPTWRHAGEATTDLTTDANGLRSPNDRGSLVIPMHSPYVFVGGKLHAEGTADVSLSWDGKKWAPVKLTNGSADLDPLFPHDGPARYSYYLRLKPGAEPVRKLSIENDLQMAWLSLPALELGANQIEYTDATDGPRQVRITHRWVERSSTHPPKPVAAPVFPPDGGAVRGTKLQFRWQPAEDPDGDAIVDHQFFLSDREDMAWPLSSNFHRLVSKTADKGKAQFSLQYAGLLSADTTYYWKVRPRDAAGVWGPWSKPFTFATKAPHPPTALRLEVDKQARTIALHWQPAAEGTRPLKYKVYGSDEKGFTVSDVEYVVNVGNQKEANTLTSPFPANLMQETPGTSCRVVGADLELPNANKSFYRVVALDADGIESGPSDFIELPRPFIFSQPATGIEVRMEYHYQVRTLASLGDLRSRTKDPTSIYNATYWDVEHPVYSLESDLDWLQIDATTGLLTGRAPVAGRYEVTVKAAMGQRSDSQTFTLQVDPL